MKKISALLAACSAAALSTAMAGDIIGTVTDAEGSVPLRGAEVTVNETGQKVTTGRDGSFRVSGLDAGSYTLTISYIGAPETTASVSLASDDATSAVAITMGGEGDVLVVTGQRGSLNSALNQQRAADGVVTVLSADSIAQLPDENVAEAARRGLGVSIANDQGEGRFITIRGINSQLNSTSINGVRITSPEAGDRRVALDVIDADVLKNIVISKTLSADMDGDAIGGAINIETISGLDREDRLVKIKAGTIYTDYTDDFGTKVSGTYANNYMDGRFGVALSGSFQNREFESDNKEVDGGWETGDALPYPKEELEFRNYEVERERTSLAANFDFMATENTKLYLHSLYNDFSDQELRSRTEIKVEDAIDNGDFSLDTANNTVSFFGEDLEIDRDIKDRLEEQRIWSAVTGFEHTQDIWTFDGSIAFTHAEEEEPNRVNANFDQDIEETLTLDVSNVLLPRLATVGANYLDASGYELDKIENEDGLTEDEELAIAFNIKREVMWGEHPGYVKAGVKSRMRDKSYDYTYEEYGYEGDGDTLGMFSRTVDYPLDRFGPAPDAGLVRAFLEANRGNPDVLELDIEATVEDTVTALFEAEEDVLAGYVMGQVDINNFRITAGVRVEQTEVSATANEINVDDIDDNMTVAENIAALVTPVSFEDDYTDVLPSIALRWDVQENVIIRASYYGSIIRPNFGQFVPFVIRNEDDEVEAGNRELDRTKADNFDLLVEYYPTDSSIFQAGIFYKDLENLITQSEFDGPATTVGVSHDDTLETFVNLDEAEIFGVEIGYQQALIMLPAPWDGLIAGANYTYTDSEATLPSGDKIEVPGQSEHIFNLILGYDKGPFDLRAAYSYKGENVDDVDVDGVGEGRVILDQSFLDLSAKYRINENVKLYVDAKNVLDTELEIVDREDEGDFLNQYEIYGRVYQAGIQVKF